MSKDLEFMLDRLTPRGKHETIRGYLESDTDWMEANREVLIQIMEIATSH
jgi:hypothetical protein